MRASNHRECCIFGRLVPSGRSLRLVYRCGMYFEPFHSRTRHSNSSVPPPPPLPLYDPHLPPYHRTTTSSNIYKFTISHINPLNATFPHRLSTKHLHSFVTSRHPFMLLPSSTIRNKNKNSDLSTKEERKKKKKEFLGGGRGFLEESWWWKCRIEVMCVYIYIRGRVLLMV